MHAFALVLGSIMAYGGAKQVVTDSQRIVSYFRASHRPLATLKRLAATRGINTTLATSNKTRLTSVHLSTSSVEKLRPAFEDYMALAQDDSTLMPPADVAERLEDLDWWAMLKKLNLLLEPFSKVIMAIQSERSTLADVARYWLYLAASVEKLLPKFTPDFQRHIVSAFNKRAAEMDSELGRLALFLDPRFRDLVCPTKQDFAPLLNEVGGAWHLLAFVLLHSSRHVLAVFL